MSFEDEHGLGSKSHEKKESKAHEKKEHMAKKMEKNYEKPDSGQYSSHGRGGGKNLKGRGLY